MQQRQRFKLMPPSRLIPPNWIYPYTHTHTHTAEIVIYLFQDYILFLDAIVRMVRYIRLVGIRLP